MVVQVICQRRGKLSVGRDLERSAAAAALVRGGEGIDLAESRVPGAVARQVALRHGVHPNQLYKWRRELSGESAGAGCSFVPVTLSEPVTPGLPAPGVGLAIEVAGAVVRVAPGVAMDFLRAVLGVVKGA